MKYSKHIGLAVLFLGSTAIGEPSLLEFAKKDQNFRTKLGERSAWVWRFILQDPSIVEVKIIEVGKEPHVKLMVDGKNEKTWIKCKVLIKNVIYANRSSLADSRIARVLSGKGEASYVDILVPLVNGRHPEVLLEEEGHYTLALSSGGLLPEYTVASNIVDAPRLKEAQEILKDRRTLDEAWYNASVSHIQEYVK